jgi:hypothetical protein
VAHTAGHDPPNQFIGKRRREVERLDLERAEQARTTTAVIFIISAPQAARRSILLPFFGPSVDSCPFQTLPQRLPCLDGLRIGVSRRS